MIKADAAKKFRINVPSRITPGSLRTVGTVYPSASAQLMSAVKGLIGEPYG